MRRYNNHQECEASDKSSSTGSQGNKTNVFNIKLAWFAEVRLLEKADTQPWSQTCLSLSSCQLYKHKSEQQRLLNPNFVFDITDYSQVCFLHTEILKLILLSFNAPQLSHEIWK